MKIIKLICSLLVIAIVLCVWDSSPQQHCRGDILTSQEVVQMEIPAEPKYFIKEIPLSKELQKYTFDLCKDKNVDYELILAVMSVESEFNEKLVYKNTNKTTDSGLMQINTCHVKWLRENLGVTNLFNSEQNILSGVTLISNLVNKYGENDGLMAYNMGEYGMKKVKRKGFETSRYSRKVMSKKTEYEKLEKE